MYLHFYISREAYRDEMYISHGRLCVSVCLSVAAFPHYCADPDVSCRNGRACHLAVHCWVDLQSVHVLCCSDNIMPNVKCRRVLVLVLCLVLVVMSLIISTTAVDCMESRLPTVLISSGLSWNQPGTSLVPDSYESPPEFSVSVQFTRF